MGGRTVEYHGRVILTQGSYDFGTFPNRCSKTLGRRVSILGRDSQGILVDSHVGNIRQTEMVREQVNRTTFFSVSWTRGKVLPELVSCEMGEMSHTTISSGMYCAVLWGGDATPNGC